MKQNQVFIPFLIGIISVSFIICPTITEGYYGYPTFPSGEKYPELLVDALYLVFVTSQYVYGHIDKKQNPWKEYEARSIAITSMLALAACLPVLMLANYLNLNKYIISALSVITLLNSLILWLPVLILCAVGKQPTLLAGRFIPVIFAAITSYFTLFMLGHST
jgi:hypothetical protein